MAKRSVFVPEELWLQNCNLYTTASLLGEKQTLGSGGSMVAKL
jgi:hypothetical protein